MDKIVYLDNAATTRMDDDVLREMMPYFSINYGNASSIYRLGKINKNAINQARERIAKAINADPSEIYFTSGGSESDNLALKGIAKAYRKYGRHVITSKIEHPAILETCKTLEKEGFDITYLNVNKDGIVDIKELEKSIRKDTILISIMYANNEVGTIEPIEEIGRIARRNNIIFHTDAVQAVGNVRIDVKKERIDSLSMSAHKFYGPKGVGVLYVRNGISFIRQLDGGHQEKDKRSGTENVHGIVGVGKAIELAYNNLDENIRKEKYLRDLYIKGVINRIDRVHINGGLEKRLPGNSNISFLGIKGADLVEKLDEKGICVSSGSACSSGLIKPSNVVLNLEHNINIASSTLRVTFGKYNTIEDVKYLLDSLEEIIKRYRG